MFVGEAVRESTDYGVTVTRGHPGRLLKGREV